MSADAALFRKCLAGSMALHAAVLFSGRGLDLSWITPPPVEIDLTNPLLGLGPAKLGAPKRATPGARGPALPVEEPLPPQPEAPAPPKDWTLPGPKTETVAPPAPPPATPGGAAEGTGTSPLPGGTGQGADYGSPGGLGTGGAPLVSLPRLLNRDDVLRNLRRFYPEPERRAGREGTVLVDIHIGADGLVGGVDIAGSAGSAFDAAAQAVAKLMRFSPAQAKSGPVPVKIRQAMVFRLQDE